MISLSSRLNQLHPDWYLGEPGRKSQLGRNQMVLDLSRRDVRDHLFKTLSQLLSSANVEYVKWDMNRPLCDVFSLRTENNFVLQSETAHRYVLIPSFPSSFFFFFFFFFTIVIMTRMFIIPNLLLIVLSPSVPQKVCPRVI